MLAESTTTGGATRGLALRRVLPAISPASAPDSLECLLGALDALRELAEQTVDEPSVARADACAALSQVDAALDAFHAALEQELHDLYTVRNPFSALLVEHVRSCAARQRADVARLRAQAARPETSLTGALRAAWALALVMRVEVVQLARDVRL
jgi:hypothetical protein